MNPTPLQIVILAYDGIIRFLDAAQVACLESDPIKRSDTVRDHVGRAKKLIQELNSGLNLENGGEVAVQLRSMYEASQEQLDQVHLSSDRTLLESIRRMFAEIRDAWFQISTPSGMPEFQPVAT